MDRLSGDQKLQSAVKLNEYQFFKRTLQFVVSISVFSFFVWYSSGFSILPQSFNVYFSTFLFSMFTHTLERKYMFLICNGILAFLAKSSLSSSPSISALNIESQASNLSETKALPVSEEVVPLGSFVSSEDAPPLPEEFYQQEKQEADDYEEILEAGEEEEDGSLYTEFEKGGNEACSMNAEEDEGEEKGSGVMGVTQDDEADTTTATNEDSASTEKLNRKIEECIRKMKEEIRIETQRQLIAV